MVVDESPTADGTDPGTPLLTVLQQHALDKIDEPRLGKWPRLRNGTPVRPAAMRLDELQRAHALLTELQAEVTAELARLKRPPRHYGYAEAHATAGGHL